jgi:hypothetical protein
VLQQKQKKLIDIKTDSLQSLNGLFNDYLLNKKQKFQQKFNALTLEKFADDAAAIRQYQPNFSQEHFIAHLRLYLTFQLLSFRNDMHFTAEDKRRTCFNSLLQPMHLK